VVLSSCATASPAATQGGDAAPRGGTFIEHYDGKYRDDPRMVVAIQRVHDSLPAVIARLESRVGVDDTVLPPTTISVVDGGSSEVVGFGCGGRTESGDGVVTLTAEDLVRDFIDSEELLAHELVHVVHGRASASCPTWLSEGMARWTAALPGSGWEVPAVSYALRRGEDNSPSIGKTLRSEATLASGSYRAQALAGFVAFSALEELRGSEFVEQTVARLLRDPNWREVLEQRCGVRLDEILAEVRTVYFAWWRRVRPGLQAIELASELVEARELDAAEIELRRVRAEPQWECMWPWGERLQWTVRILRGRYDAALTSIRVFQRRYPHHPERAVALIDEFELLMHSRRWSDAIRVGEGLLRDLLWRPGAERNREVVERRVRQARLELSRE